MGKLAEMDPEHTRRWCDNTMRFMARGAPDSGMIRSSTMVGIDLTPVPYYGRHLRDDMLKSKPLKGAKYFDAHMTTHSIGPGYEIPLSDTRMIQDDKVDIILHENLKKIQRAGLRPQLYLADRGFSVACMRVLRNTGRDFLMPAAKNSRVRAAIEKYHRGEIGAASRFTMKSAEFGAVSFNLLIVKKDGCKASDPVAEQVRGVRHQPAVPHPGGAGRDTPRDVQAAVDNRDRLPGDQGRQGQDVQPQAAREDIPVSFCAAAVLFVEMHEIRGHAAGFSCRGG